MDECVVYNNYEKFPINCTDFLKQAAVLIEKKTSTHKQGKEAVCQYSVSLTTSHDLCALNASISPQDRNNNKISHPRKKQTSGSFYQKREQNGKEFE